MTSNDKLIRANFAFILFVLIAVCVNLNTRVRTLETSNSELQQTIRTQKDELEKAKEKNTMQDVIINKLNNDYNSRMAQELQEIADTNGVGDSVKVYIVRKYNKRTRWDCNHSAKFKEFEFPTKTKAMEFRNSQKKGVFDVYEKEK